MGKDQVTIDVKAIKKFFKSADVEKVTLFSLLIACMILVFFIRMLPGSLPVADDWAANSISQNIRAQIAGQVNQQFPALPQSNKDALIAQRTEEALVQQAAEVAASKEQIAQQLRQRLQYVGENGKTYTYLGDLDSYFWLRYTRNLLEKGTVCDEIVDDVCMDMYTVAPIGAPTASKTIFGWNPSLHTIFIGILHKFLTFFDEGRPMTATSFLVPVLIGTLGVIPAFFVGRRLGGNVAGVIAAILISLHPLYLSRSMGSDNDIWNIFLPLCLLWATTELLSAKNMKKKYLFGCLLLLFFSLHAATWVGWWFNYLILFIGILGTLGYRVLSYVLEQRTHTVWKDKSVQSVGLTLVIFYVAALIATLLTGGTISSYVIDVPKGAFYSAGNIDQAIGGNYWPNVLTTVAELNKSSFSGAVGQMGGKISFFFALIGVILLLLPRKRWSWEHWMTLSLATGVILFLLNQSLGRTTVLVLLAIPMALALSISLWKKHEITIGPSLILLVWILATVYASYSGVRFILLMIPAFGIVYAVTAGRVYEWVTRFLRKELKWHKFIINVLVFLAIMLILIKPVTNGYNTARGFVPSISDAWWETLENIKAESSPDAIINSWWDFGHWFKYVADRRVSADGTSQHTHIPRWLGLALVTPDERESIGVLRMLNCGSDVFPSKAGYKGAYGKLLRNVEDPLTAEMMVRELVVKTKAEARTYLQEQEFTDDEIADVLTSSHCESPEDYFITSGDMVGKAGVWSHFGLWDFQKAWLIEHRYEPKATVLAKLAEFGYEESAASALYLEALSKNDEGSINAFVSPWPGYVTRSWAGCTDMNDTITCPLNLGISNVNNVQTAIESVTLDKKEPNASTMTLVQLSNGRVVQRSENNTPGTIIVADADAFTELTFADSPVPNLAYVIDLVENRVLVADPHLARSTFTQLFYLDGRYAKHYEKFDDRTTFSGSRILTWKVNWDGPQEKTGTTTRITN
ncbi:MAG: hypothetical protein OXR66_08460 [Candidatus Woesearchaeota archaeon]|nr:hypothetical protein [Candidatus Woesearchaeota archaeon]